MIKLLALDIDYTLTDKDGRLTREVVEALGAARARCPHLALLSSRPPAGVDAIARLLGGDVYRACYFGAVIEDPTRRELQRLRIDRSVGLAIAAFADAQAIELLINCDDTAHRSSPGDARTGRVQGVSAVELLKRGQQPVLMGAAGHETSVALRDYCAAEYPAAVTVACHVDSDGCYASALVVHRSADKGTALTTLGHLLAVNPAEMLAIGDNEGDVSMFRVAGWSVCVGAADTSAGRTATIVAPVANGSGVRWALQHFL